MLWNEFLRIQSMIIIGNFFFSQSRVQPLQESPQEPWTTATSYPHHHSFCRHRIINGYCKCRHFTAPNFTTLITTSITASLLNNITVATGNRLADQEHQHCWHQQIWTGKKKKKRQEIKRDVVLECSRQLLQLLDKWRELQKWQHQAFSPDTPGEIFLGAPLVASLKGLEWIFGHLPFGCRVISQKKSGLLWLLDR